MNKLLLLLVSHGALLALGFGLGIYYLPIKIAPPDPTAQQLSAVAAVAQYRTEFKRGLPGSDWLHWGEGAISLSATAAAFSGELAPGPDYRLYLVPRYVETEAEFLTVKAQSVEVGRVRTFENFMVNYQPVDLGQYNTVVVWCETFGRFITAGRYR